MKAMVVLGSPRTGGNSTKIANTFLEAAKQHGYETESYNLNSLTFRGCQACNKCKTESERCTENDGLTKVLNAMESADILVLTSPIYFGQISGQLKCFVDRTFSFLTPDFHTAENPSRLAPGKKCLIVLTQGDTNPHSYEKVCTELSDTYRGFGYDVHCLRGFGMNNRTEAETTGFILEDAVQMAEKLCKS